MQIGPNASLQNNWQEWSIDSTNVGWKKFPSSFPPTRTFEPFLFLFLNNFYFLIIFNILKNLSLLLHQPKFLIYKKKTKKLKKKIKK